jgi:nucleoside-diphosphate-sugar epimerase
MLKLFVVAITCARITSPLTFLLSPALVASFRISGKSFPERRLSHRRNAVEMKSSTDHSDIPSRVVHIVTGSSGYVGRAVVHELLSRRDLASDAASVVVGLVRPAKVSTEQAYWDAFAGATHCVHIEPYDMLDGGESLSTCLKKYSGNDQDHSVTIVYHVASTFGPTENHEQTALDNVQGTTDLVKAVATHFGYAENRNEATNSQDHSTNQCRIVLTSSMAAVRGSGQLPKNGLYYTIEDWNNQSKLGSDWGSSYQWSKMKSEEQAIHLATAYGIPLVTLCPPFIFGPPSEAYAQSDGLSGKTASASTSNSFSLQLVESWLSGSQPVQSRLYVDIRDLASVQVAAGIVRLPQEKPLARFIVSTERRVPSHEVCDWLKDAVSQAREQQPDLSFSKNRINFDSSFDGGAISIGEKEVESEDRLNQELGLVLRPVKSTMMEMAQAVMSIQGIRSLAQK